VTSTSLSVRASLLRRACALLAAMALPGCSGCAGRDPLAYVPHDAVTVFVVPEVEESLEHLDALLDKLGGGLLSGPLLRQPLATVRRELGFDPRKPQTLRDKGFDPGGGLAVAFSDDLAVLVVAIADTKAVDRTLRQQANKLLRGGAVVQQTKIGGVQVHIVTEEGQGAPLGAWTFVKRHVIAGAGRAGKVAEVIARLAQAKHPLTKNKRFAALRDELGTVDALVYVDQAGARKAAALQSRRAIRRASPWLKKHLLRQQRLGERALSYFGGAALGLRLDSRTVRLKAVYSAPAERAQAIRRLLVGRGDSPGLGKLIGPDALAMTRVALDLKHLLDQAIEVLPARRKRRLYRQIEQMERENNFSLDKDALTLLGGRYAAAVYPPPRGALERRPQSARDVARVLPMAAIAQVRDVKRAQDLLARLERFLVLRGLDVRPSTRGDRKIYTLESEGRPLASWTLTDGLLVVGTGKRLMATLALIDGGGESAIDKLRTKAARRALKRDDGLMLDVDVGKIARALQRLEVGMEAKLLLSTVLGALSKLGSITLWIAPGGPGLLGELSVTLADQG